MTKKIHIVITGPESSGKTTFWLWLQDKIEANYIDEYAREFLEKNGLEYVMNDITKIAFSQLQMQLTAFNKEESLIISDTCLLTLKIWQEYKYGLVDPFLEEWYGLQRVDFYILCKPDLEWQEDPLRESKDEREILFEIYKKEIENKGIRYEVLEGIGENRNKRALELIKDFVSPMK